MNKKLFLLVPLVCSFASTTFAKKTHEPVLAPAVSGERKITYVDFTEYFKEKPNAKINMVVDGKPGQFAEVSTKTPIYFERSISFQAEGSQVKDITSTGAKISLEKRNGVWGFRVKTTK